MDRDLLQQRPVRTPPVSRLRVRLSEGSEREVAAILRALDPPILKSMTESRLVEFLWGTIYGVIKFMPAHAAMGENKRELRSETIERELITFFGHLLGWAD
jgi:hypothetical protein